MLVRMSLAWVDLDVTSPMLCVLCVTRLTRATRCPWWTPC
jgi:hypothetical protein